MFNLGNYPTGLGGSRYCFNVLWCPELTDYECAKEWFRYDTENHPNTMKWDQLGNCDRERYINTVIRHREAHAAHLQRNKTD